MSVSLDQSLGAASDVARWIERDPARLGGVPVFRGTRVPVKSLFDHLHAGDSLETFLDDFPGVTREQAEAVIDLAARRLLDEAPSR
jgi:uncharacterized protein (DUF433 family)